MTKYSMPAHPAEAVERLLLRGMSQSEIAAAVNVNQSTISRALHGRTIRLATFLELCSLCAKLEKANNTPNEVETWI